MAWTSREARAFCKKYKVEFATCNVCHVPYFWVPGQLEEAPGDCGRWPCMVAMKERNATS